MQTAIYSSNPTGNHTGAIVRENLRRFWPVSFISFLIMFCLSVLPSIVMRDWYGISLITTVMHPTITLFAIILPIIVAAMVFRYLHTTSGSTLMHAFPVSRLSLFRGSLFSGLILLFSPFILTYMAALPFCKTGVRIGDSFSPGYGWSEPHISEWLSGFGVILVVLIFAFALATLAANLAGNGPGLVGITLVFNYIGVFVLLIVFGLMNTFLIGFSNTSFAQIEAYMYSNPQIYSAAALDGYRNADNFSVHQVIVLLLYVVIAIGIIVAAYHLYRHRKLERAGSTISFSLAERIITYVITFVCMSGMGILFFYMNYYENNYSYSVASFVAGCAIGATLSYIVVTMLNKKTVKVFTKKTFKGLGIFAIIGVLFVSFMIFDLTGYTDRVPMPERIQTAEMTMSDYPFPYPYESRGYEYIKIQDISPDDFASLTEYHRGLIEAEKDYRQKDDRTQGMFMSWYGNVSFAYELNGGMKLNRNYDTYKRYTGEEMQMTLASMPSFRKATTIGSLYGYDKIARIEVPEKGYVHAELEKALWGLSREERAELAQCLDEDYLTLPADELIGASKMVENNFATLRFEVKTKNTYSNDYYSTFFEYRVTSSYTKTLAWLKMKGIDYVD